MLSPQRRFRLNGKRRPAATSDAQTVESGS